MRRLWGRRRAKPPKEERTRRDRTHLSVAVIAAVIGFLVVVQLTTYSSLKERLRGQSPAELALIIKELSGERVALREELATLTKEIDDIQRSEKSFEERIDADEELRVALRISAGDGGVEGAGVLVRISDPETSLGAMDLADLVRELRSAGAEAISINESRVVARTGIMAVGGEVRVGAAKISEPYVVQAIGDAETLEQALSIPGGYVGSVEPLPGVDIDVRASKRLVLASAADYSFRYSSSVVK